ncbi:MAG: undecaprenyl-diphosphatase, partial [Clostridia bacterium]|nr:undecaprenyl-diphosphatase [Clostridia bacterium]
METFIEILKAIFIGIVQGITEWLPVSSTGHMIIANEFIKLDVSEGCWDLFEVITQLGSILAVIILFFDKLNPWSKNKDGEMRKKTWSLWFKVVVAVLPAALIGLVLEDWLDKTFYKFVPVAIALIVYGVLFIVIERINK